MALRCAALRLAWRFAARPLDLGWFRWQRKTRGLPPDARDGKLISMAGPTQIRTPRRKYPETPRVGAGAVITDGDRVLLIERAQPPARGLWTLPGGLVKLGEPVSAAARREAREETGLEVEIGRLVDVVDSIELDADGRVRYHYVIADFLARPRHPASARAGSDAAALAWVRWTELSRYCCTPGLEGVLAKARQLLGDAR